MYKMKMIVRGTNICICIYLLLSIYIFLSINIFLIHYIKWDIVFYFLINKFNDIKNISIIQILSSLTLKINLKTYFEAVINKATN
jgi:hypothetical protein